MKEKSTFYVTILILSIINMFYSLLNLSFIFKMSSILLFLIFLLFYLKKKKHFNTLIKSLCIIFLSINIIYSSNLLNKEINYDFANKSYSEIYNYAKKNNITLKTVYEYSDDVKKNKVINYDVIEDKNLISILISGGPNYDKKVIIPDMLEWDLKRITEYLSESNLTNVNIKFIKNNGCETNTLISQSKTGTIKRNEKLDLTFCMSDSLKKFNIKDLTNKNKIETIIYLKSNDIDYEIKEEFNKVIEKNKVIKSDKNVGDELTPHKSKVILYVSKGTEIIVPEFSKMSKEEIYNWILNNNINAEFKNIYDKNKEKDEFVKANYKKGDKISEQDTIIIYFSRGKLTLPNFSKLNEFTEWAKRNEIKYKEEYIESEEISAGDIVKFSIKPGEKINSDETITVYIAKENKVTIPNFIGMNKNEITTACNNLSLNCNFVYKSSDKEKDTCIKQNLRSNTKVNKNTKITLTLASAKVEQKKEKDSNNDEVDNNDEKRSKSIIDMFES